MKNILILLFLAFCFVGSGQIIDFTDPNFKNALVNTKCVDTDGNGSIDGDADLNNDGEIDVSEALKVKRLNVDNQNIISLEGLQHFQLLTNLICSSNNIGSLTIENFPNLSSIICNENKSLNNLTLANLPKLLNLYCPNTGLTSLTIKDLLSLTSLVCSNNDSLQNLTLVNLPKLSTLNCSSTGLISLELNGLLSLPAIDCNNIESLKSILVTKLPKLTNLYLSKTGLISLELKDLYSLSKLTLDQTYNLKKIELKNLSSLKNFSHYNSKLNSLVLEDLPLLSYILCYENSFLHTLSLNNLPKLVNLTCNDTEISSLELNDFPALKTIFINSNDSLKFLKLRNLPKLLELNDNNTGYISVSMKDLPSMYSWRFGGYLSGDILKTIELENLSSIYAFSISGPSLVSVDLKNLAIIKSFYCNQSKALNFLSLINLPSLTEFECTTTGITSLKLIDLPSLSTINCSYNNLLETLVLTNLPSLSELFCVSSSLHSISLISEKKLSLILFDNNPNLVYICSSEINFPIIKSRLKSYGYNHVQLTTYCTFDPFIDFGVLKGNVILDANNNGCDIGDKKISAIKFDIFGPSKSGTYLFDGNDKYKIPLLTGTNTVTPKWENQGFIFSPEFINLDIKKGDTITQDFCITPKGIFRQTNITVIPLSPPARPGFDASYKIIWKNVGNQIESGTLNFTYDETLLDYISASQMADQVADGIIKWNFTNLLPFEKREITVTLKVNRPTDTPAVNAGDKLYLTASILDNIFTLENTVVGSYDPNDKTCLQGDRVKPDMVGKYVDYLIRFENTGNYAAENVVVKDIIDIKTFDVSTLQITDASHEVYTRVEGNKVEFIFENIQLPFDDANNDGYIAFKIKTLPTLVLGDSLKNLADIYFDYNFPIRTNEAQTTVALPVFTKDITTEVNIYPNPVTDILYLDTNDHWSKAEIFDIAGRIMRSISLDSSSMDVSGLESGTYFVRLKDGAKVGLVKFVKI